MGFWAKASFIAADPTRPAAAALRRNPRLPHFSATLSFSFMRASFLQKQAMTLSRCILLKNPKEDMMLRRSIFALSALLVVALFLSAKTKSEPPKDGWFTTSDNIKIHYLTLGDKGSWVVLIHGYTGNAKGNWFDNGIAQALAKNHRVVAIDNR